MDVLKFVAKLLAVAFLTWLPMVLIRFYIARSILEEARNELLYRGGGVNTVENVSVCMKAERKENSSILIAASIYFVMAIIVCLVLFERNRGIGNPGTNLEAAIIAIVAMISAFLNVLELTKRRITIHSHTKRQVSLDDIDASDFFKEGLADEWSRRYLSYEIRYESKSLEMRRLL